MITATSIAYKEKVCQPSIRIRSYLKIVIQLTSGNSSRKVKYTFSLLKSFSGDDKKTILEKANITMSWFSPEGMVALKANLRIPWKKPHAMAQLVTYMPYMYHHHVNN